MAKPQTIGLYLTDDKVVIADSNSNKQQRIISAPINVTLPASQEVPFHTETTEEIHIVGTLLRLLRENKITPGLVNVSIPLKDIFVRTFVIPFMPTSEINSVVYFEAKKYVPFELRLLDYVYDAIPFDENKQKKLRIVFYAIRKQVIEKIDRVLKQAGCKAAVYESSLISLAKQLIYKNQLKVDQKTIVIYSEKNNGQVIFFEKGISYFFREFPLAVSDVHDPKAIDEVLRNGLLREVRKSLGFYNRQISQDKIKEVLILSATPDKELMKNLTEELAVKVRFADPSVASGLQTSIGMDVLCAAGSSVVKPPSSFSTFNFINAKAAPQMSSKSKIENQLLKQLIDWKKEELVMPIKVLLASAVLTFSFFYLGQRNLGEIRKENIKKDNPNVELAKKTGEEIESLIKKKNILLESYKSAFSDRSQMALMLISLTNALPDGVFLDSSSISFVGKNVLIDLKGNIYLSDKAEGYKIIKVLFAQLRKDKYFAKVDFKLNTVQEVQDGDQKYFSFSITGS